MSLIKSIILSVVILFPTLESIKRLKVFGLKKVSPYYFTGGMQIGLFREDRKEGFIDLGCGAIIKIK